VSPYVNFSSLSNGALFVQVYFIKKNVTTYRMEYLGLGYTSMRVSLTLVCVSLGLSRAESYTSRVHVGRPVLEGGMRGVQERVL